MDFFTSDKMILLAVVGGIIAAIRWAFIYQRECEEEDGRQ